jgi:putative DNA primase/helicase
MTQNPHAEQGTSPPLVKVLNRLSKMGSLVTTKKDGSAMAQCPCHEDKKQSLSITTNAKGDVIMFDHAGCETPAIVSKMGLRMADLFVGNVEPSILGSEPKGTIVEVYPYTDEQGTLQYEAVRLEPKGFRQRRPDGQGGYLWNMQGAQYYLYKLAVLLKKKRATVFIPEGEKDADRLWEIGLPATTNVGGAGKWREEYTQQLVAAKVRQAVIFPDNDEPGRKHAEKVAGSLHEAGITVKVVRLPVGEKGDVSDYLAEHPKEELFELIKATAAWAPGSTPSTHAVDLAKLATTILSTVVPRKITWLWPGHIPRGVLTILAGDPGDGKSFLTEDWSARLSLGGKWPTGEPIGAPQYSIHLCGEDNKATSVAPRLEAMGANREIIEVIDGVHGESGLRMLSLQTDLALIRGLITKRRATMLVVSPVNAYLGSGVDNYRDPEVRQVLTPLAQLAEELDIAVVLIMHLSKAEQQQLLYKIGGSVGFAAVARAVYFVRRDGDDRGLRLFACGKMSDAAEPLTVPFRIAPKGDWATVEWEAPIEMTAQELFKQDRQGPGPRPRKREEAQEWLRFFLENGPKAHRDVLAAGSEEGHTYATLRRAAAKLKVMSRPLRGEDGRGVQEWVWELPVAGPSGPEEAS